MSPDARRTKRPRARRYDSAESLPSASHATRGSKGSRRDELSLGSLLSSWVLSPYLAFLLLTGIGVAILRLDHQLRLTVLWLVLLGLVLLYGNSRPLKGNYGLLNLARGALLGTVVALPFFLVGQDFFHATASRLYGIDDLQVLLERAVFLVPILEESYFRGVVQRERGLLDGAVLFGLAQGLYFISAVSIFPLVIAGVVLGSVLLGLLYGYVCQRYGLTASIGCHVAVNLMLFVLPSLLQGVGGLLA